MPKMGMAHQSIHGTRRVKKATLGGMANLLPEFARSVALGMLARADALRSLDHKLLKGELRELFVSDILVPFMPRQFSVGSGIIVNQHGEQSHQTDIIIYDNTVLPPFIAASHLGVYPAECVLATVEVKSELGERELLEAEQAAKRLVDEIVVPDKTQYHEIKPLCAVFGFRRVACIQLMAQQTGVTWLNSQCPHLSVLAVAREYSWARFATRGIRFQKAEPDCGNEVVRFTSILVDTIMGRARLRQDLERRNDYHTDWLSVYLRFQRHRTPKDEFHRL